MKIRLSLLTMLLFAGIISYAQEVTADEIISNYIENTGGEEAWTALEGIKMQAKVNQGGMEIPIEIVQLEDGRTYTKITFQGQPIMQNVFNGEVLWGTNFQTRKAEKVDQETTDNMKLEANDFPTPFLNYKEKGYTVELLGKETIEGTETYKVKVVKEPKTIAGEEVEDVTFYYFETENFVPIAQETEVKQGPVAGKMQFITLSDYQEVDGLYFPFAMTQGLKGQPGQGIMIENIELNPDVSDDTFAFPEAMGNTEEAGDNDGK
ncbi:MAG: outer membrane lipoprotein-sorting protein [Fulvivirga sp.]|nr:outer membrane lipoprotein-sorting protein [Fulvivirga sp.]